MNERARCKIAPNETKDLHGPPIDRVNILILDKEASIPFWLCAARRNKNLLDSIPLIV